MHNRRQSGENAGGEDRDQQPLLCEWRRHTRDQLDGDEKQYKVGHKVGCRVIISQLCRLVAKKYRNETDWRAPKFRPCDPDDTAALNHDTTSCP
jgi:hypothetical protein